MSASAPSSAAAFAWSAAVAGRASRPPRVTAATGAATQARRGSALLRQTATWKVHWPSAAASKSQKGCPSAHDTVALGRPPRSSPRSGSGSHSKAQPAGARHALAHVGGLGAGAILGPPARGDRRRVGIGDDLGKLVRADHLERSAGVAAAGDEARPAVLRARKGQDRVADALAGAAKAVVVAAKGEVRSAAAGRPAGDDRHARGRRHHVDHVVGRRGRTPGRDLGEDLLANRCIVELPARRHGARRDHLVAEEAARTERRAGQRVLAPRAPVGARAELLEERPQVGRRREVHGVALPGGAPEDDEHPGLRHEIPAVVGERVAAGATERPRGRGARSHPPARGGAGSAGERQDDGEETRTAGRAHGRPRLYAGAAWLRNPQRRCTSSAARMVRARSTAGPRPQKWRKTIRGSSPVMCPWMATTWMPPWQSARSTPCSSASRRAKAPSTTAAGTLPANTAQLATPMAAPISAPCTVVCRPKTNFTMPSFACPVAPSTASSGAAE